jgi:hypothetical protein
VVCDGLKTFPRRSLRLGAGDCPDVVFHLIRGCYGNQHGGEQPTGSSRYKSAVRFWLLSRGGRLVLLVIREAESDEAA